MAYCPNCGSEIEHEIKHESPEEEEARLLSRAEIEIAKINADRDKYIARINAKVDDMLSPEPEPEAEPDAEPIVIDSDGPAEEEPPVEAPPPADERPSEESHEPRKKKSSSWFF